MGNILTCTQFSYFASFVDTCNFISGSLLHNDATAVSPVEQELLPFKSTCVHTHTHTPFPSSGFCWGSCCSIFDFLLSISQTIVCPFSHFSLCCLSLPEFSNKVYDIMLYRLCNRFQMGILLYISCMWFIVQQFQNILI